jgi:hypothetical protein
MKRWKRLHQFLSEVGVKALRTQLGQTLGIAQVSDTAEQNEANNGEYSEVKEICSKNE